MKKLYLLALVCAATLGFTACGDDDDMPEKDLVGSEWIDPGFAKVLEEKGVISNAETVTPADVAEITEVEVDYLEEPLTSLRGIEYFTKLTELDCSENQLTSLDLSKNTKLTWLDCEGNQLTSLDLSKNTELTRLYCSRNQLTSLDLSKNTELYVLFCIENKLTSLDLSKNTKLTLLSCVENQLTSLDLPKSTELETLYCSENQLTSLDISKNAKLTEFRCYDNPGVNNVLTVYAWFDDNSIPKGFTSSSWTFDGKTVNLKYVKK